MFLLRQRSVVSHDLPETWPGAIVATDVEFCGLRLEVCGIDRIILEHPQQDSSNAVDVSERESAECASPPDS